MWSGQHGTQKPASFLSILRWSLCRRLTDLIINVASAPLTMLLLLLLLRVCSEPFWALFTAATWACRGGRMSDDPGPFSSPSSLFLLLAVVEYLHVLRWFSECLQKFINRFKRAWGFKGKCKRAGSFVMSAWNGPKGDLIANDPLQHTNTH